MRGELVIVEEFVIFEDVKGWLFWSLFIGCLLLSFGIGWVL